MPRNGRRRYDDDAMRKIFAHQEERLLLYRELVKINEETLREVFEETIGGLDGCGDQGPQAVLRSAAMKRDDVKRLPPLQNDV